MKKTFSVAVLTIIFAISMSTAEQTNHVRSSRIKKVLPGCNAGRTTQGDFSPCPPGYMLVCGPEGCECLLIAES